MVLERAGLRVSVVALDILIARPSLRDPLLERAAALEIASLILVATHTHSGPGGYLRGMLAERTTGGGYREETPPALVEAAADALETAVGDLHTVVPAALEVELELAENRRAEGGPAERSLPVLRLEPRRGGDPILVFAYGMHPVVRSPVGRLYSADYVGIARRALARQGMRALFLPGPLGDQNPKSELGPLWSGDFELEARQTREIGNTLAEAVSKAAAEARPGTGELLAMESWAEPPRVRVRRFCALWWLQPLLGRSLRSFLSQRIPLHALAIGSTRFLALPLEPSSAIGARIRALVAPDRVPFVVAHANDWLGYAVEPEQYRRGGYEACLSLHGPELAGWLVERAGETLRRLEAKLGG